VEFGRRPGHEWKWTRVVALLTAAILLVFLFLRGRLW
jgi:hypothetical protein